MEPGLNNRDALTLVYRTRLFFIQNRLPYPLALGPDIDGAKVAVAGGYVQRVPGDDDFVTLTEKGEAYLDRLMRCE